MSDYLKPAAMLTAFTSMVGGGLGFAVAGPAGIVPGAKIGGALGIQTVVVGKAEEGVDAAGRKIDKLVDKAEGAVERIANLAEKSLMNIADVWSKMVLTGYAISIGMSGVKESMIMQNELCKSAFESINCSALALTTLSLNMLTVVSVIAIGRQVYKMTK